jgi:hypothetical protein
MLDTHAKNADLYARIVWHAMQQGWTRYPAPFNWPQMSASMTSLVARYPDPWNINNMAHIACSAYDKALTKSLTDKIGGENVSEPGNTVIPEAWGKEGAAQFVSCQKWSHGTAVTPLTVSALSAAR